MTKTLQRPGAFGFLMLAALVGCQSTDRAASNIPLPSSLPTPQLPSASSSATNATRSNNPTTPAIADVGSRALPNPEPAGRPQTGLSTAGQITPVSPTGLPTTGGNLTPTPPGPPASVATSGWKPTDPAPGIPVVSSPEPPRPSFAPPAGIKDPLPIEQPTPPGPPSSVTVPTGSDIVPPALPPASGPSGIVPPASLPSVQPGK